MPVMILIAGPCVLDGIKDARLIVEVCADVCSHFGIQYVFKASFDKANRTSIDSYRGPGLDEGLSMLREIRDGYGVEVTTDFHLPEQAGPVADVVDIIQVPAFLSRQTDIVVSAAFEAHRLGKVVSVKKAQWMRPNDMVAVSEKIASVGSVESWAIERGSVGNFGLVVDMGGIRDMGWYFDKVIFDATHSVQMMGTPYGSPEKAPVLARSAIAAGADGIFMEVHPYPPRAKCDGANSIQLSEVPHIVEGLKKLWDTMQEVDQTYPCPNELREKAQAQGVL